MAMADVSYVPGALTAIAGDQCWALVEVSPDSPAVGKIWEQLGHGVAADALLASLVANGMGGTPGFTLLVAESGGQHRLFCRGAVGATVVTRPSAGSGPPGQGQAVTERIDGVGLLTWREEVVGDAERIFLGEPPADTAMRLPATSGVLLAGCVVVDLASLAARDTVHYPLETPPAAEPPGQTVDFYPDTITMAHPGSLADPVQYQPPSPRAAPAPHAEPGPGESGSAGQPGEPPGPDVRTISPDRIGPVVPALICPGGHVNPPSGAVCHRCGAPLPHDPVPVPRPVLGVLRLSLGDVITLDRGVLMGRNPRTDFVGTDGFGGSAGGERPHVVKLPTGDGDISRTHLRVVLDGWHVLVTDLNSTNGTLVTLPGRETLQLRPGEPLPIEPGTVVTLADGIDFRYETSE